ncbi:centromere protein W [Chiloscyllium plagiosum]|uniref:centromere protein W n=1 Tax=Chiloscyllium plagiosum TaxID=36176 RepID=UPI001CB86D90|nr:centromere protein W [Chiloscyllium plagiosum]
MVGRAIPRRSLHSVLKKHKPQLRLSKDVHMMVHLNCLLFLHRLAVEARTKAVESKSSTIQPKHVKEVAKVVLKKSRG